MPTIADVMKQQVMPRASSARTTWVITMSICRPTMGSMNSSATCIT
jgi:hypothetical protein